MFCSQNRILRDFRIHEKSWLRVEVSRLSLMSSKDAERDMGGRHSHSVSVLGTDRTIAFKHLGWGDFSNRAWASLYVTSRSCFSLKAPYYELELLESSLAEETRSPKAPAAISGQQSWS